MDLLVSSVWSERIRPAFFVHHETGQLTSPSIPIVSPTIQIIHELDTLALAEYVEPLQQFSCQLTSKFPIRVGRSSFTFHRSLQQLDHLHHLDQPKVPCKMHFEILHIKILRWCSMEIPSLRQVARDGLWDDLRRHNILRAVARWFCAARSINLPLLKLNANQKLLLIRRGALISCKKVSLNTEGP
jgi:hypothetical protein